MPAKAKALLHQAATFAINEFEGMVKSARQFQSFHPRPRKSQRQFSHSGGVQTCKSPGNSLARSSVASVHAEDCQVEPLADRLVEADFEAPGACVHHVYASSFLQFADGADIDLSRQRM